MNKFKYVYLVSALLYMFLGFFFFFESMEFIFSGKKVFLEYDYFNINSVSISMYFFLDWMGLMFLGVVSVISSNIFLYSCDYMKYEKNYIRFLVLMILFISSMWLMVSSPSLVSILLGWDGLGLSSYLLVIYYQNKTGESSGMLTILMNRIGDVCFLMSMWFFLSEVHFGFYFLDNMSILVSLFFLTAAFTKSAQIPFSVWLPAAMAAPTPVSSLVHSSTLVTAGVYLMIRVVHLMDYKIIVVGCLICLLTNIMSGLMTFSEKDFKKIIALSTLSQVSLMMISVMSGMKIIAFFHLVMHAFFKSVLFMCTGFVIHSNLSSQEIRNFSSMFFSSPFLICCVYITNLSLMGFPFMAGFFSKDLLLENLFSLSFSGLVAWSMVFSIFLTIYYSSLILKVVSSWKGFKLSFFSYSDFSIYVFSCVVFLSILSYMSGFNFVWVYFMEEKTYFFLKMEKMFILSMLLISGIVLSKWFKNIQKLKLVNKYALMKEFYSFFMFSSELLFKIKIMVLKFLKFLNYLSDFGWLSYMEVSWKKMFFVSVSSFGQMSQNNYLKMSIFLIFFFIILILLF